jgi:hypothetical protein
MHTEHTNQELVAATVHSIAANKERLHDLLVMMAASYMETACFTCAEQAAVFKFIKFHTKSTIAMNECDRQLTLI